MVSKYEGVADEFKSLAEQQDLSKFDSQFDHAFYAQHISQQTDEQILFSRSTTVEQKLESLQRVRENGDASAIEGVTAALLRDSTPGVRMEAVITLGEIGGAESEEYLWSAVFDQDSQVANIAQSVIADFYRQAGVVARTEDATGEHAYVTSEEPLPVSGQTGDEQGVSLFEGTITELKQGDQGGTTAVLSHASGGGRTIVLGDVISEVDFGEDNTFINLGGTENNQTTIIMGDLISKVDFGKGNTFINRGGNSGDGMNIVTRDVVSSVDFGENNTFINGLVHTGERGDLRCPPIVGQK